MGDTVNLNGRNITVLPARHVVPAAGYRLDGGKGSLVYTGDTTVQQEFWEIVNRIDRLQVLIIETAFSYAEKELAVLSRHLCPDLLADEPGKLQGDPAIDITHLKPGEAELTMREIGACVKKFTPKMLVRGQEFEL